MAEIDRASSLLRSIQQTLEDLDRHRITRPGELDELRQDLDEQMDRLLDLYGDVLKKR